MSRRNSGIQTGNTAVTQGRHGPAIWVGNRSPNHVKPHPFQLRYGDEGAQIYFGRMLYAITTATFAQVKVDKQKLNALVRQDSLPPTSLKIPSPMPGSDDEDGGEEDDPEKWTSLDWFGDVYLYWEVDAEDADITLCDLRGPDEPDAHDLPPLDSKLHRKYEDDVTKGQYYTKIGSVSEDGEIEQIINADLPWFVTLFQGNSESESEGDSGGGSSGSSGSGDSGDHESSGSGGGDGGGCDHLEIVIGDPIVLAYGAGPCFDSSAFIQSATVSVEINVNQVGDPPLGSRCKSWWAHVKLGGASQVVSYYLGFSGTGTWTANFNVPATSPCAKHTLEVIVTNSGAADILIHEDVEACLAAAYCSKSKEIQMPPYCGETCDTGSSSSGI